MSALAKSKSIAEGSFFNAKKTFFELKKSSDGTYIE